MNFKKNLVLLGLAGAVGSLSAADVAINVRNIKNTKGQIIVWAFQPANAKAFPVKVDKALTRQATGIGGKTATLTFKNLEPGVYAFCVLHDENGNGKTDVNFMGIPTEATTATNNPRPKFRAPSFDEAKVNVPSVGAAFNVDLLY